MRIRTTRPKPTALSSDQKAAILRENLFQARSVSELSEEYRVPSAEIRRWRSQVKRGLASIFEPESERIERLGQELVSLKKELGEL